MTSSTPKSRRAILGAAFGALGAAVAARLSAPSPAAAANGDNMVLGQANSATATTSLAVTGDTTALQVTGSGSESVGKFANSGSGPGIRATTTSGGYAAGGVTSGTGKAGVVGGYTTNEADLAPAGLTETGVLGVGQVTPTSVSTGVWGEGDFGVYGFGYFGVFADGVQAVRGQALPETGAIGVVAVAPSTSQYALLASGKVKFSRSGRTYFATGTHSRKVTLAGVTTSTHVFAQLATNRTGVYIQAVVPTAGSFTIYTNKNVPGTTYVHWVVLDA